MGKLEFLENLVEEKLLGVHTAYIAKVISTNGKTAKIQPLGNIKAYGKSAQKHSPLSNVPILNNAQQKLETKTIEHVKDVTLEQTKSNGYVTNVTAHVTKERLEIVTPVAISSGDLVLCVCCDRDISEAKKGNSATPQVGHHSMSDSVIVGIL
jgi:hypothetical protein